MNSLATARKQASHNRLMATIHLNFARAARKSGKDAKASYHTRAALLFRTQANATLQPFRETQPA